MSQQFEYIEYPTEDRLKDAPIGYIFGGPCNYSPSGWAFWRKNEPPILQGCTCIPIDWDYFQPERIGWI